MTEPVAQSRIKVFVCDLNWILLERPSLHMTPSAANDWAAVDPDAYFDWHVDFGNNAMFCQAYTFGGYAFYPTKLGPQAAGDGRDLLPRLYEKARATASPFWSYFSVAQDLIVSNLREAWVVPGSRSVHPHGYLAPESPWTDMLCERIHEFLTRFPVDWLLFDMFQYGALRNDLAVQPAWFVEKPFAEIIGRAMPQDAAQITADEDLRYRREALARQFGRIRDCVRSASPGTRICFNVPYFRARDPLWVDHPMMLESDMLFAESSDDEVVNWLLEVKRPGQRVMTTIIGRPEEGVCDPDSWRKWRDRGCDFFGYAFAIPPDFRPHASYASKLEIVRNAFREMSAAQDDLIEEMQP